MNKPRRKRLPRAIARIITTAQTAVLQLRTIERTTPPNIDQPTINARVNLAAALYDAGYPTKDPEVCCGHGPHGGKSPCCPNAGKYDPHPNADPRGFHCPEDCSCHD